MVQAADGAGGAEQPVGAAGWCGVRRADTARGGVAPAGACRVFGRGGVRRCVQCWGNKGPKWCMLEEAQEPVGSDMSYLIYDM